MEQKAKQHLVSPMEQKAKQHLVSPFLRGTEGGSNRGTEGGSNRGTEGGSNRGTLIDCTLLQRKAL
ncbi:hypothetical protein MC7420_4313 [Coleofasciculus chthonoplastes PCC 7420]|uniref:Uncharacterized protein n=1 Tax=Coleofasciculus chthonoplastes PCC 7420 TaxID=118168 RepID=B4W3W6_9CYAN|nr:hypothetical protein MC7420_4313 [Coleofasciculus chthonoplastes PCC 7420]